MDRQSLLKWFTDVLNAVGWDISASSYDSLEIARPARATLRSAFGGTWSGLKELAASSFGTEECDDGTKNVALTSSAKSLELHTVDQLLSYVGYDLSKWDIVASDTTAWETTISAKRSGTGKAETFTNIKVWAKLKPKPVDQELLSKLFIKSIEKHVPTYPVYEPVVYSSGILAELCFMDLHFGKLGVQDEVGEDYNKEIAKDRFRSALKYLVSRAVLDNPEMFLLPLGNDFLHIDNLEGATTKGTRQDVDGRSTKVFHEACMLVIEAIDYLLPIAPVTVLIVPGNHDAQNIFHLGEVLKAWYRNVPDRVTIDNGKGYTSNNDLTYRKYYRWGKNLTGFTHLDKTAPKSKELPLLMASERKSDWAECLYFEWHNGHNHKKIEGYTQSGDTYNGVYVRMIPSLSGEDFWHYRKGYVKGLRQAEAFILHKEDGCISNFTTPNYRVDN